MAKAHIQVGKSDDISQLLDQLFWKQPEMAGKALEFLKYLKQWGRSETPYRVSQWENYSTNHKISQSQYHNMLKRLKTTGMIEKKYNKIKKDHELFLSESFSENLKSMGSTWDDFRRN